MKTEKTPILRDAKRFEKWLRLLPVGDKISFRREDCVITFTRQAEGVSHTYGGGAMHYQVSFREAAEWFCADDGKGDWMPEELGLKSL